jgi:hypothetical protein
MPKSSDAKQVFGKDLRIGDVVEVWWGSKRDTITALVPYCGPLQHIWPAGAQLASFAILRTGMTIDNSDRYAVVAGPSMAEAA